METKVFSWSQLEKLDALSWDFQHLDNRLDCSAATDHAQHYGNQRIENPLLLQMLEQRHLNFIRQIL